MVTSQVGSWIQLSTTLSHPCSHYITVSHDLVCVHLRLIYVTSSAKISSFDDNGKLIPSPSTSWCCTHGRVQLGGRVWTARPALVLQEQEAELHSGTGRLTSLLSAQVSRTHRPTPPDLEWSWIRLGGDRICTLHQILCPQLCSV